MTKTIATEDLIDAISQVAGGGVYFGPKLALFVLQTFSGQEATTEETVDPLLAELTPREREVLRRLARGHAYKRIALELEISPRTVESHVRGPPQAAALLAQRGRPLAAERGLDDGPI